MLRCNINGLIFTRAQLPIGVHEGYSVHGSGSVGNGMFWAHITTKEFRTKTFTSVKVPALPASVGVSGDLRVLLRLDQIANPPLPRRPAPGWVAAHPDPATVGDVVEELIRETWPPRDQAGAGLGRFLEQREVNLINAPTAEQNREALPAARERQPSHAETFAMLWTVGTAWMHTPGLRDPYSAAPVEDVEEHLGLATNPPRPQVYQMFWLNIAADPEDPEIDDTTLSHAGGLVRGTFGGSFGDPYTQFCGMTARYNERSVVIALTATSEAPPGRAITNAITAISVAWRDASEGGRMRSVLREKVSEFFHYFSESGDVLDDFDGDHETRARYVAQLAYRETAYATVARV